MRRSDLASLCSWLVALSAPATATAQQASASGSLGAGMFGSDAAASAEVGVDVAGERWALGIGGRLRWVADEGVRTRDWDEPSEWATLVRYLMYTRAPDRDSDGVGVAAVMGQLGGVSLGHGALIQGYTTGLDVDHRGLGAQVRVARGSLGFEGLLDDVIAPRVAGVRGSWQHQAQHHALAAGVSAAADFTAPRTVTAPGMPMPVPMATLERAFLPMAALDGSAGLHREGADGARRIAGTLHAELAAISTVAAGLHLGLTLEAGLGATRLWGTGAVSAGTAGYVPGWVGPLYERDRVQLGDAPGSASQLDRATAGGPGHIGSRVAAGGRHELWGEVELAYAQRPGLPGLATARLAAPHFRDVQGALWGAIETGQTGQARQTGATGGPARVLALELRARLPRGLFLTAEAARLYRAADDMAGPPGALAPWWLATLALGASIDLDHPAPGRPAPGRPAAGPALR